MSRIEEAMNYKQSGYNCSQAVLKAYKDVVDLDEDTLNKLGSGFGVGMGCMEATCGSLIGANMLLGLLNNNPRKRTMTYSATLMQRFKELTGSPSANCNVLKGIDTGKVICPCIDCVRFACQALEETLKEAGIEIDA